MRHIFGNKYHCLVGGEREGGYLQSETWGRVLTVGCGLYCGTPYSTYSFSPLQNCAHLLYNEVHEPKYLSREAVARMDPLMENESKAGFDVTAYLTHAGTGRRIVQLSREQVFFSQGDMSDCVYYLHKGRVKITVISAVGKEATIRQVSANEFFGEKALEAKQGPRVTTATAITACTALRIARSEFLRVMHEEHAFSYLFSEFLLQNSLRTQSSLVDQLFNSAEKRLARLLLLMAELVPSDGDVTLIPPVSQEALASMIGSTRTRVNLFISHFRKLGYIDYDGRIKVHKSLLHMFLRD